ncbi:hypothetical protein SNEBB_002053 [Seison nebaliae]|nr:hypothetical protein SNEBB_002053 [Seison nebaliae]
MPRPQFFNVIQTIDDIRDDSDEEFSEENRRPKNTLIVSRSSHNSSTSSTSSHSDNPLNQDENVSLASVSSGSSDCDTLKESQINIGRKVKKNFNYMEPDVTGDQIPSNAENDDDDDDDTYENFSEKSTELINELKKKPVSSRSSDNHEIYFKFTVLNERKSLQAPIEIAKYSQVFTNVLQHFQSKSIICDAKEKNDLNNLKYLQIDINNIDSIVLELIIKWCEISLKQDHIDNSNQVYDLAAALDMSKSKSILNLLDGIPMRHQIFFKDIPPEILCLLANGAECLKIPILSEHCERYLASMIKGKTVSQLHGTFGQYQQSKK